MKNPVTLKVNVLIKSILCFLLLSFSVSAQKKYQPNWKSVDSRPIPKWFTDAKFGIFIHWGLYSVPSYGPIGKEYNVYAKYAEWYWDRIVNDKTNVGNAFREFHLKNYGPDFKYTDFASHFKAELFKPEQWADLFAASGAKYVVLTSKHHEGFALWPSSESWNWNSLDVGPHRDIAGDLTNAVKAKGLRMGFYYSLYEWFNPLYQQDVNKYVDQHMLPQMKDLVTRYKPDIFWPDGEWQHESSTWRSAEFLSWLYNESSVKNEVVVNDRWGKETRSKHGGYYTTEYNLIGDDEAKEKKTYHPWEECRGMGGSFGYNRNESLSEYNTSAQLVHTLIEKVAGGGNLLLNIGPAADGTIPVIMQQRLTDMGKWLNVNGDAIYESEQWENAPKMNNVYFTKKGKSIYVISTVFPDKDLVIQKVGNVKNVSLLGYNGAIKSTTTNGTVTINPPMITPATNPCEFAWVYKLELN